MVKNLQIYLLMFLVLLSFFCKKSFKEKLILGEIYNPNMIQYSEKDVLQVFEILKDMFYAVEKKDLNLISHYIAPDKGVFIDLKAHKTKEEFLKEVHNSESYLNAVYLNTEKLVQKTNDPHQISLYQLIRNANSIKADFYILTPSEIEVKLILIDSPKESYRFNNPYFIKIDQKWYIYRLF